MITFQKNYFRQFQSKFLKNQDTLNPIGMFRMAGKLVALFTITFLMFLFYL